MEETGIVLEGLDIVSPKILFLVDKWSFAKIYAAQLSLYFVRFIIIYILLIGCDAKASAPANFHQMLCSSEGIFQEKVDAVTSPHCSNTDTGFCPSSGAIVYIDTSSIYKDQYGLKTSVDVKSRFLVTIVYSPRSVNQTSPNLTDLSFISGRPVLNVPIDSEAVKIAANLLVGHIYLFVPRPSFGGRVDNALMWPLSQEKVLVDEYARCSKNRN